MREVFRHPPPSAPGASGARALMDPEHVSTYSFRTYTKMPPRRRAGPGCETMNSGIPRHDACLRNWTPACAGEARLPVCCPFSVGFGRRRETLFGAWFPTALEANGRQVHPDRERIQCGKTEPEVTKVAPVTYPRAHHRGRMTAYCGTGRGRRAMKGPPTRAGLSGCCDGEARGARAAEG